MSQRTIIRGSIEYLEVTVTCDFTLNTQPVEFSFDQTVWRTATWQGSAGTTRTARLLLDSSNTPAGRSATIWVRITDDPEIPILDAGRLNIRD
jgi:hypothetical protein